jgi:hypothetical protein
MFEVANSDHIHLESYPSVPEMQKYDDRTEGVYSWQVD